MQKEVSINTQRNDGLKWYQTDNIFAKGYIFDENDRLYQGAEIVNLFKDVQFSSEFKEILKYANGSFSVIINRGDQIFACVDRLSSMPLFYEDCDYSFSISDTVQYRDNKISDLDIQCISEFKMMGCICNNDTLLSGIKQLQGGQFLHFDTKKNILDVSFYFIHTHKINQDNTSVLCLLDSIEKISVNFIQRTIKTLNNRSVVIPLSGGYDSRYIACMFKKAGYTNVTCYTYGRPDSFEVKIAKKTAEALNYKWLFIEYNEIKWKSVVESPEFINYCLYSFNYSSLPHIQDYIAIRELTYNNHVSQDAVFIPGYCGDLIGGSYIPIEALKNDEKSLLKEGLDKYILRRHTIFNKQLLKNETEQKMLSRINKFTSKFNITNIDEFISINESWFTIHKVSKYVINSLRLYEFWGYEWRMPLWDNELFEFWYTIPIRFKKKSRLYNDSLHERIFKPYNVDFKKEKYLAKNYFITRLITLFPSIVINKVFGIYKMVPKWMKKSNHDINAFDEFVYILQKEMKIKKPRKLKASEAIEMFALWFSHKYLESENMTAKTKVINIFHFKF